MTILIFVSRHFKLAAFLVGIGAFVQHYAGSGFGVDAFLKDRLWMITQYLVNYVDHGFARRALLGTVLRPFIQASGDPEVAAVVALLIVFALCFAICVFAIDWLLPHHETRTADLSHGLRVAFVIGSAGIMQMIRDHGRYDLSNFCLLFLAIYLALNRRLFWAGLVAAVGVLHHEAFAVFALPLVFALVAHVSAQNGESRFNRAVLLFLTPVLAAIIAVAVFGNSELAADIDLGEGARVWKRGLIEYNRGISLLHIGLLVVFWSALVSIVVWFHRANKVSAGWFFLAAMAPLLLNVLGRDHPRWFTLGFLSVIIGLGVQARVQNLRFPPLKGFMRWPVLLLCLPLGPMGAVRIFPWF